MFCGSPESSHSPAPSVANFHAGKDVAEVGEARADVFWDSTVRVREPLIYTLDDFPGKLVGQMVDTKKLAEAPELPQHPFADRIPVDRPGEQLEVAAVVRVRRGEVRQ